MDPVQSGVHETNLMPLVSGDPTTLTFYKVAPGKEFIASEGDFSFFSALIGRSAQEAQLEVTSRAFKALGEYDCVLFR